ncbi:MAG: DUF3459 domain-containing protein [Phycisphaerales bacterium]|nr:DUF3459 domain-containing protein [Phycisphaerales bacterium]
MNRSNSALFSSPTQRARRFAILATTALVLSAAGGTRTASGAPPPASDWPPAPPLVIRHDTSPGPLPPSITAEALPDGLWRCTFICAPGPDVRSVALVGTFNGWLAHRNPMRGPDGNGRWSTTVDLPGGRHEYKFLVSGDQWRQDPLNPESVPDNHGGQNSLLRLGTAANLSASTAATGDGQIEALAIEHDPSRPLYFQRLSDDKLLLRVRTLARDVENVEAAVRAHRRSDQHKLTAALRLPMASVKVAEPFEWWEQTVPAPLPADVPPAECTIEYAFVFQDGDLTASSPRTYGVDVSATNVFTTPDWAKHAVWYQIFPERFRNGDRSNDPPKVIPWTADWFTPQPWEAKDGRGFYSYVYERRYGGDLAGILEQLPYIRDLGFNAIYLNPVFKAPSLHKYDATSYIHIDDAFGRKGDYEAAAAKEDLLDPNTWTWTESDKLFLKLIRECHRLGIKVIIDGVFNHVGIEHPAFLDVQKRGQQSPYADWFAIESWEPFKYRGWAGTRDLPEFRKDDEHGLASATLRDHIFAVTRRWMDPDGDGDPGDGIDGWRLDVPNEVPMAFWVEWRKVVKSINPDAYITGEIWQRADQWLDGHTFDAVMNYEFAKVVVNWVFDRKHKISASEADARFRELRLAYPLEATLVLQNLMNSHDTDRVASMALNPDRHFDDGNRIQDNGPKYNNAKPGPEEYQRVRLALLIAATYVGAPMVYYGDEAGMWGADDPTCRKPMLWDDLEPYEKPDENFVMKDHRDFYRRAFALRNAHPALRTGEFRTLLTDDQADVWAFIRKNDDEQLIVALNPGKHPRTVAVPLPKTAPTRWRVVFDSESHSDRDRTLAAEEHQLRVTVPAIGGVVLHSATPK